jgi:hypothetical protein
VRFVRVSYRLGGHLSLLYEYSLDELHELARRSAAITSSIPRPFSERRDIALGAIVECLCIAQKQAGAGATEDAAPVESVVLITVGVRAVKNEMAADVHEGGVRQGKEMPRFGMYWSWANRAMDPPEDKIIEPMALKQVWERLSEVEQGALLALIEGDGSYTDAAAHLGISYTAFRGRLHRARAKFYQLWFSPESPPASGKWGMDRPRKSEHLPPVIYNTLGRRRNKRTGRRKRIVNRRPLVGAPQSRTETRAGKVSRCSPG